MLYLVFLILVLTLVVVTSFWFKSGHWIGLWNGKEIDLVMHRGQLKVYEQGQEIGSFNRYPFASMNISLKSSKYGAITIKEHHPHSQDLPNKNLVLNITGESVVLEKLPSSYFGQSNSEVRKEVFEQMAALAEENFDDERWLMSSRLLKLVREAEENPEFMNTGLQIQNQLKRFFLIKQRIVETQRLLETEDQKELVYLLKKNDARIDERLEAMKRLHLLTISREVHSTSDPQWEEVQLSLKHLVIEDRLERSDSFD